MTLSETLRFIASEARLADYGIDTEQSIEEVFADTIVAMRHFFEVSEDEAATAEALRLELEELRKTMT